MQLGNIGRLHRADPLVPEEWVYEQLDRPAIFTSRRGLAAGCNVLQRAAARTAGQAP